MDINIYINSKRSPSDIFFKDIFFKEYIMPYKAISSAFYGFTINSSHCYNVLYVQHRIYW